MRLLRSGGPFTLPPMVGLYNGRATVALYKLGAVASTDRGATVTRDAANPVLSAGSGWESSFVVQPSLAWDGTQYVTYYAGHNGSVFKIGRATSPDLVTWTKYGSNPVLTVGGSGAIDEGGLNVPTVLYDPDASPPWKMWYGAWTAGGTITVAFADSTDGLSWTKRGRMLNVGSSGAFDDIEAIPGAAIRVGSTWYLYYTGRSSAGIPPSYRTGVATFTDPANAATYTKLGVCSGLSGTITLSDGLTYDSNQIRSIIGVEGGYRAFVTVFHPTSGPYLEKQALCSTTDLVTFTAPTGPMLPLVGSTWDETSAENLSLIQAPAA